MCFWSWSIWEEGFGDVWLTYEQMYGELWQSSPLAGFITRICSSNVLFFIFQYSHMYLYYMTRFPDALPGSPLCFLWSVSSLRKSRWCEADGVCMYKLLKSSCTVSPAAFSSFICHGLSKAYFSTENLIDWDSDRFWKCEYAHQNCTGMKTITLKRPDDHRSRKHKVRGVQSWRLLHICIWFHLTEYHGIVLLFPILCQRQEPQA